MFFAKSSTADYEKLVSLDVLGLESKEESEPVHQEFRDQLERSEEGWYQTGLIWKSDLPDLPNNEKGSKASNESESEVKPTKAVLKAAVETKDELDEILERFQFRKSMRITAWMKRFVKSCQNAKKNRQMGPLDTEEVQQATEFWIRREQAKCENTDKFKEEKQQLGPQKNGLVIYVCHGRLEGDYPIYLPSETLFIVDSSTNLASSVHLVYCLQCGI
eukprot:gene12391-13670_t